MPTYEYQCKTCGASMDVFQSIKARPLSKTHCAACNATRPVRRLIGTGGAVLFKGSGFYQTDYRSESYKSKVKAETESKPTAGDSKAGTSSTDSAKSTPATPPAKTTESDKAGKKKE